MELTPITIVFRSVSVIISLIMAFFAYKIYANTKGATKGWLYLSIGGVSLFVWSSTALFFSLIDVFVARMFFGIVFMISMAFFVSVAYTKLAQDFNVGMPKWITPTLSAFLVFGIFFIMVVLNYFTYSSSGMELFFRGVLTSAKLTLGIVMLFTCVPTFYLMKSTKNIAWVLAFLFCIFVGFGLNIGNFYDSCCWSGGESSQAGIAACNEYNFEYVSVYDMPCVNGLVGVGKLYQIFLLIGLIVADVSYYKIWKNLTT